MRALASSLTQKVTVVGDSRRNVRGWGKDELRFEQWGSGKISPVDVATM